MKDTRKGAYNRFVGYIQSTPLTLTYSQQLDAATLQSVLMKLLHWTVYIRRTNSHKPAF
jgi:hypothetical protein